ncbi:MAG: LLM class flavin-dependent oxidoreductase, partial [Solirubrobacteraceae bacterium]
AELAGFDVVWVPDSQFLWRDVWATLAIIAGATERIGLGLAVTNFETRHVSVTASAAATLQELAPGRVLLGVGTGDSGVKTLGLRPTPLARMREQLAMLRELTSGRTAAFAGRGGMPDREMRIRHAADQPIPIYLAATGPRALALAGELADGVIVLSGAAPAQIASALAQVRCGAERAGRTLEDIDVWIGAHTAITADEHQAAQLAKPLCASAAQLGASEALRSAGIEITVPAVVDGVYPDLTHAEDWDQAIAAAGRYVDDEAAERYARTFTLIGPPARLAAQIETILATGVSRFYMLGQSSYELPEVLLAAFRDSLAPRLARRA